MDPYGPIWTHMGAVSALGPIFASADDASDVLPLLELTVAAAPAQVKVPSCTVSI